MINFFDGNNREINNLILNKSHFKICKLFTIGAMRKKEVILLLSNKSDESVIQNFKDICKATKNFADCIFVYHHQEIQIPECIKELNHYIFTDQIFDEVPYIPLVKGSIIPGCDHFPYLKFYLDFPDCDFYWNIEDDVRFRGDWGVFFDTFRDNHSDFLSTYINTYYEEPDWPWWNAFGHTGNEYIELQDRMKSFNPIRRLSNRAMATLHKYMSNGWYGHQEVLMPTLFKKEGYTLTDIGGHGPFVPAGFEDKFYNDDSMSHLPVEFGDKQNFLYHPIKEIKRSNITSYKRNCVISAVGRGSLHKEWIKESPDFDLHLLIYDDSYSYFYKDTDFIFCQRGYKLKLVYNYLQKNPDYLKKYDYFFLPDDDISISTGNIHALFKMMGKYKLEIVQPALVDSYYTYECTLKQKFSTLRYVNFVEMMAPCFSRNALKKVLFTFNENKQGWGSEYHWPVLIGFTGKEMALLDKIEAIHTRPLQSFSLENHNDGMKYIKKYGLSMEIKECGYVSTEEQNNSENKIINNRKSYTKFIVQLDVLANQLVDLLKYPDIINDLSGKFGISIFFLLYYQQTGKRKYLDITLNITDYMSERAALLKNNLCYSTGLAGLSWYIEYLAQNKYIENETDEILEEICQSLNNLAITDSTDYSLATGLTGLAQHYLARIRNPLFDIQKNINRIESDRLFDLVDKIEDSLQAKGDNKLYQNEKDLLDCIYFLCQINRFLPSYTKSTLILEKLVSILLSSDSSESKYWLYKGYVLVLASEIMQKSDLKEKAFEYASLNNSNSSVLNHKTAMDLFFYNQLFLKTGDKFYKDKTEEILEMLFLTDHDKMFNHDVACDGTDSIDLNIKVGLSMLSVLSDSDLNWESYFLS